MKAFTPKRSSLIAAGFSVLLTACAGSVAAADFNPQPDPPGKTQNIEKGKQNPPAYKTNPSGDTKTLAMSPQKTGNIKNPVVPKSALTKTEKH